MKITNFCAFLTAFVLILLPSCLSNNNETTDYTAWRNLNELYLDSIATDMTEGHLSYEKITPVWDPSVYTYVRWHNDRSQNVNKLNPLSNSTIIVKYTLTNIAGDTLDSSSSFSCVPNQMVTGFWNAVTHMNVHDTVTAVIPYNAGYGVYGSGKIPPYSTLTFGIRLDSISNLY